MDLLETERLVLRELRLTDVERISRYANDEDINRYLFFDDLGSHSGALKYVKKAMSSAQTDPAKGLRLSFKLAILIKPERDFIGSCWLDIIDESNRRATIGYFIDQMLWGRGYATEAAQALITYGFAGLKLHRIEATCDADHKATRRVLEKVGLRREAHLRQNRRRQTIWRDSCLYAIIEDEKGH